MFRAKAKSPQSFRGNGAIALKQTNKESKSKIIMTQIEQVVKQIKSEFRLDNEGKAFVSIRGAARLADISPSGLSDSLKSGVQQKGTKLAEYLTVRGFDSVQQNQWAETGIPDLALAAILSYYAHEAQERYRTQQAKLCCYAFESIGIRSWVQDALGWEKPQSKAIAPELEVAREVNEFAPLQASSN